MSTDEALNAKAESFTQAELDEFRDLVEASESRSQLERIRSRVDMPAFIDRVGVEKCNSMFKVLLKEIE